MAEYNQDRFELEIQAKEVQPPERIAKAKVFVSIFFSSLFGASVHACTQNQRALKNSFHSAGLDL